MLLVSSRRKNSGTSRYNPWHFFHHGLLHRKDSTGNKMYAPYGAALVKTTPFSSLPTHMRKLLGSEYNWASWLSHPLSGYGVHFFLKAFELGRPILGAIYLLSTRGLATMFPLSCRSSAMPSTVSSLRPILMLVSESLRRVIPGTRNQSRMTPTTPLNSCSTMLSALKRMYGPRLSQRGRTSHGGLCGFPGLRAGFLQLHPETQPQPRDQMQVQNLHS